MDETRKKIEKRTDFLHKSGINPNLPIVEELQSANENLKNIGDNIQALADKETPDMPIEHKMVFPEGISVITLKGDSPKEEELLKLIRPLIPTVKDGHTPTDQELSKLIRPLIPQIKDGKTPTRDELLSLISPLIPELETIAFEASKLAEKKLQPFIPKIEDIEKDLSKLGIEIRDSLELLPDGEKLKIEAIQGLRKELNELRKIKNGIIGGITGVGVRDLLKDIDISDQLDGLTTTFNIQGVWNIINVNLSSYPYGSLRKGIDFTYTPTSITFSSTIDPSTQLSSGQQCILTVVQA